MAISLKNIKSLLNKKKEQIVPASQPQLTLQGMLQTEEEKTVNKDEESKGQAKDYSRIFCQSLQQTDKLNLQDYFVPGTETAYYIKNYLTSEQESKLLDCIFNLDQDRWFEMKSGRALKRYGGEVGSTGLTSKEDLPPYFHAIAHQIFNQGLFRGENPPNHVLLNKYRPGDGIMPHKDGPAYFPYVCILSLNSGLILNIWNSIDDVKEKRYLARFYLEPRSLLIFTDKHYSDHFHGIEETIEDDVQFPSTIISDANYTTSHSPHPSGSESLESTITLCEEKENCLKINNLKMTDLKPPDSFGSEGNVKMIQRDDFRLSLTIRYVPVVSEGVQ